MLNCKKWKIVRRIKNIIIPNSYLVEKDDYKWTAMITFDDNNNISFKYITSIHKKPSRALTHPLLYASGAIQCCMRDKQNNIVYYEEKEPVYYA